MALKTVTNCVGLFVFSARDNVICIACGQTRDFTHRIELNKTMTPYLFLRHLILALCLKIKNNLRIKAFVIRGGGGSVRLTFVHDMDRSTNSLDTEVVKLFTRLSGQETPIHVPDFAFSHTAGGRAPALSFVVSLRAVLFFTVL